MFQTTTYIYDIIQMTAVYTIVFQLTTAHHIIPNDNCIYNIFATITVYTIFCQITILYTILFHTPTVYSIF